MGFGIIAQALLMDKALVFGTKDCRFEAHQVICHGTRTSACGSFRDFM
jgi:hypothetical protein